jgi:hypothetical protein
MPAGRGLADQFILLDLLFGVDNGVGVGGLSSCVIAGTGIPFELEKL